MHLLFKYAVQKKNKHANPKGVPDNNVNPDCLFKPFVRYGLESTSYRFAGRYKFKHCKDRSDPCPYLQMMGLGLGPQTKEHQNQC